MKSYSYILAIIITFSFFGATFVGAQGLDNFGQSSRIPNITRYDSLEDIINALTGLIRPLFIITFFGVLLYGAWNWLTSQGDPEKIKKARAIIIAGIVGFSLAVFAPNIAQIVANLLGVSNPFNIL